MQHDTSIVAADADAGLQEPASKKQRLPLLCRNCGNLGHAVCKMIFTEEQCVIIKQNHQLQLDERAQARKVTKHLEKQIEQQQKTNSICKNCGEFGHKICKKIFDKSEKLRITELQELRCQCPVKVKSNPNLPPLVCRNCAELVFLVTAIVNEFLPISRGSTWKSSRKSEEPSVPLLSMH